MKDPTCSRCQRPHTVLYDTGAGGLLSGDELACWECLSNAERRVTRRYLTSIHPRFLAGTAMDDPHVG